MSFNENLANNREGAADKFVKNNMKKNKVEEYKDLDFFKKYVVAEDWEGFKKAMEESMTCSNDPVCSLSMGQGRDSLNLSACYSCCLIPETSCEEFNIFLDRGTIVGTYENREMGFYSKQLHSTALWKENSVSEDNNEAQPKNKTHVIITNLGTDLRDSAYAEIWKDLKTWAVDAKERALLSELENSSDLFLLKEKPYRDCIFQISGNEEQYKCDLFWKESQVALFTSDNEDCYEASETATFTAFIAPMIRLLSEKYLMR